MQYKKWLDEWLSLYVKPAAKERTYKKYLRQTQNYIIPSLGAYSLDELSAQVLQRFAIELARGGLAANTVNGIITVIKSSLKRAVLLGAAKSECTGGIMRMKTREKKIDCFTLREQRKIETYIRERGTDKLFGVLFCLYTGLRIGELLALKWQNFDLKNGIFSVSETCMDSWQGGKYVKILQPPKTETSNRVIPIPKQLLPEIRQMKRTAASEYFVCGRGKYGSQIRSYQKTFARLLKKLNIPHKGFHSLRHTFATRALEVGMDVKTLSEILGHKSPTVTLNRYVHSMLEHKTDMMNRLGNLLCGNESPHDDENTARL